MTRRSAARRRRASARRHEGVGILLMLTAVLLSLSFLPRAGGIAVILGRWQGEALGIAAPALPIVAFLMGLLFVLAQGGVRFSRRLQGLLLMGLTVLAVLHTRVPMGREFVAARGGAGGGAVGAALVWAGRAAVGETGLWVLIALVGMAGVLLFLRLSPVRIVRALARAVRFVVRSLATAVRFLVRALAQGLLVVARQAWRLGRRLGWVLGWIASTLIRGIAAAARWMTASLDRSARRRPRRRVALRPVGNGGAVQSSPEPILRLEPTMVEPFPQEVAGSAAPASTVDTEPAEPLPPAARRRRPAATGTRERVHQESLLPAPPEPEYQPPPLTLLGELPVGKRGQRADPTETARLLEQTLASFGVEAKVVHWEQGPVVTRYEVQPASGVKVQRITSLVNDIALNLAAPSVRLEAPIPGKSAIGIELPNQKASLVHVKEILGSDAYQRRSGALLVAIGKDIAGHPIVADLTEMPHLLIAGATGSGKSVAINAIIASLLFGYTPRQVRFMMIDPKRVELTNYNDIPHLLIPVVTNPRAAAGALKEMLRVMEDRFDTFARNGVRNIQAYNELTDVTPLPFIVIVIDELADLMMVAPADFEDVIVRLTQMTRATGIHLVAATQRPSVDVITGLIKANVPSRIAFAVSSQVDSRTIIDGPGAEKLLGRGDMLFLPIGASRAVRAQGAFIADAEIQAMVDWWRGQGKPRFDDTLVAAGHKMAAGEAGEDGERLAEAARLIVRAGYGSVSLLQRKMRIGYVTAARLIDQLEERGIVGPAQGSNPREVLVGVDRLEALLHRTAPAAAGE